MFYNFSGPKLNPAKGLFILSTNFGLSDFLEEPDAVYSGLPNFLSSRVSKIPFLLGLGGVYLITFESTCSSNPSP